MDPSIARSRPNLTLCFWSLVFVSGSLMITVSVLVSQGVVGARAHSCTVPMLMQDKCVQKNFTRMKGSPRFETRYRPAWENVVVDSSADDLCTLHDYSYYESCEGRALAAATVPCYVKEGRALGDSGARGGGSGRRGRGRTCYRNVAMCDGRPSVDDGCSPGIELLLAGVFACFAGFFGIMFNLCST